ncbi:MAG: hypothetical protein GY854_20250, partial [Deltaproteobacteria bacterium]|nr:hypothetical protein [Deltaproteobacteria bacterium]
MMTRVPTFTAFKKIELSETICLDMLRKPVFSTGVSDLAGRLSGTAVDSEKVENVLDGLYFDEGLVWEGDYEINTIEDLQALSGYTCVTGDSSIYDTLLTNLEGLECLTHVVGIHRHEEFEIGDFKAKFYSAGHVLGSAIVQVFAGEKKIVFSGDLGREKMPLLTDREK